LILRKIIEIVATTCPISKLKCTTFDFGWAPSLWDHTALPQTPSLRGPTSKGREGRKDGKEG